MGAEKRASKTAFWRPFYVHNSVRSQPFQMLEVLIDQVQQEQLNKHKELIRDKLDPQLSKSSHENL
jgi:hypothetical protein